MRIGSLFAGIGGFDLAARRMGWTTAWYSEIDLYCNAVMAKHFPEARALGDVAAVDWHAVEPVDVVCGGFPCQDVSRVGRRAGLAGAKSGLWSEYARCLRVVRPRYVVVENSTGLLVAGRGFDTILGDLAELGYDAEWTCLQAAEVGAPHLRDRLYLLAYPGGGRPGAPETPILTRRPGAELRAWWTNEPTVARVADGVPAYVDRRRALGNAVVPYCARFIFEAIEHMTAAHVSQEGK